MAETPRRLGAMVCRRRRGGCGRHGRVRDVVCRRDGGARQCHVHVQLPDYGCAQRRRRASPTMSKFFKALQQAEQEHALRLESERVGYRKEQPATETDRAATAGRPAIRVRAREARTDEGANGTVVQHLPLRPRIHSTKDFEEHLVSLLRPVEFRGGAVPRAVPRGRAFPRDWLHQAGGRRKPEWWRRQDRHRDQPRWSTGPGLS